jgi:spermidine synthase
LVGQPDGTYVMEPMGLHMVQVYKVGSQVYLALLDQHTLTSRFVQSVVDLDDPLRLRAQSAQALARVLDWGEDLAHVYGAGIGAGSLVRVLRHRLPQAQVTAVDIDPAMVTLAQTYFGVRPDARLTMAVADARQYVVDHPRDRYDLMLIDVALGNGYTPYPLATVEWFTLCRDRLTDHGTLGVNLLGSDPWQAAKLNTLATVFPHVATISLEAGGAIAFGRRSPFPPLALTQDLSPPLVPLMPLGARPEPAALYDGAPPSDYGSTLPPLQPLFSTLDPSQPCPCGSGRTWDHCHRP